MKKIIVSALFAVLATASLAAATTTWTNAGTPAFETDGDVENGKIGQTVFQVSTNVTLIADGNAGGYNVSDKHLSGDKSYMSSSVSASIEEGTATKGEPMTALVPCPTDANIYTGAGGY
jgi:hypothetical protein